MSACKRQALIDAPVEAVWELIGDPRRHPEWWPRVENVDGDSFLEGDEYAQVTRSPTGRAQTDFLIEHREELRELRLTCQNTGAYANWTLTGAQDATFVEVEMGMNPRGAGYRVFDVVAGRMYFRRWAEQSVEALSRVAGPARPVA